jgi:hypothetical protein
MASSTDNIRQNAVVTGEPLLWGYTPLPAPPGRRTRTGAVALPTDDATAARFLPKRAPCDDQGHRWWLGAIDGGTDRSGGTIQSPSDA